MAFLDISQLSLQKVFCLLHFTSDRTCSRWRTSSRAATPSTPSQQCTARTSIISCIPGWSSWSISTAWLQCFYCHKVYTGFSLYFAHTNKILFCGKHCRRFPCQRAFNDPKRTLRLSLRAITTLTPTMLPCLSCLSYCEWQSVSLRSPHPRASLLSCIFKHPWEESWRTELQQLSFRHLPLEKASLLKLS